MSPTAGEFKSAVGLKDLYIAEITQDDLNAFVAGTPEYFAPVSSASQAPAVNSKTQYADDQAFEQMSSEGETKVEMEVTGIPLATLAKVTGRVFDAATGRMFDNGGVAPYFALGFRSKKSNGSYRYYWFLKGAFAMPGEEKASQTDSPEPKPTKITFTAIKTVYQFALTEAIDDGVKRIVGDEDATGFDGDDWFAAVQTPETTAVSAIALSVADPLDAATNVAVSKTISLTFNNALRDTSLGGIVLIRADTAAPITCVRAIDITKKIVTLDPESNLTANKTYLVSISGVTDIYGQVLANAVVDFTTAA